MSILTTCKPGFRFVIEPESDGLNREDRRHPTSSRREPLVTVEVVAAQIGVHPRSVRNYISKGLFPAYRIPGTRGVRLKLSEVNAAMRLIPATTARAGMGSFGPNAKIIDLPRRVEAYDPEADA